jgi:hypothetical protein
MASIFTCGCNRSRTSHALKEGRYVRRRTRWSGLRTRLGHVCASSSNLTRLTESRLTSRPRLGSTASRDRRHRDCKCVGRRRHCSRGASWWPRSWPMRYGDRRLHVRGALDAPVPRLRPVAVAVFAGPTSYRDGLAPRTVAAGPTTRRDRITAPRTRRCRLRTRHSEGATAQSEVQQTERLPRAGERASARLSDSRGRRGKRPHPSYR